MTRTVREDYYFDEPGDQNTDDVVEAVVKRVESLGIRNVVVASTSGETALKFARVLKGKAQVVCVSEAPYRREWGNEWPCLKQDYRRELEALEVAVLERVPYVLHGSLLEGSKRNAYFPELLVKETLYAFGQGLKVAVEVVLIAVECGYLEPYQDVIGVGGSLKGADSAVVLRATYPALVFSGDVEKRLEIREIIAMPRKKKWYV